MVYDNGMFLGQFGRVADQSEYPPAQAQPEMAGNAFCPSLVKVGERYFLWHNDESYHGGLHLWEISDVDTIVEQVITP